MAIQNPQSYSTKVHNSSKGVKFHVINSKCSLIDSFWRFDQDRGSTAVQDGPTDEPDAKDAKRHH